MTTTPFFYSSKTSYCDKSAIFNSLANAYFLLNGKTPNSTLAQNRSNFEINGVEFSMNYLPRAYADGFLISAEVLKLRSDQEADIYLKMLNMNLDLHREKEPVFALSSTTSTAVALLRVPLRQITAPVLDEILKNMAQVVVQARTALLK